MSRVLSCYSDNDQINKVSALLSCTITMEMDISPSKKVLNNSVLLRRPRPPKKPDILKHNKTTNNAVGNVAATKSNASSSFWKLEKDNMNMMITRELEKTDFIIHPLDPKGPDFFSPGRVIVSKISPPVDNEAIPNEIHLSKSKHTFDFNDLMLSLEDARNRYDISKGTISRQNYLKLTSWFAKNVPKQESINPLDLKLDHKAHPGRVPREQALIELQAMVNRVIIENTYSFDSGQTSYSTLEDLRPEWPPRDPDDALFRSSTSRYFCGQARSGSPFDASHQPLITPSEGAILECMMNGGSHLSLKAHFISQLPLLDPLVHTLTSLNLSFNNFRNFPPEIFQLHSLIFLSMRNNPLNEIPNDIRFLQNLHFLCLSFCIISELPPGLFDLPNLVDLDVSYNNLHLLPRDISKLKKLYKLNIEGNQLPGLPSSMLPMPISHIILGNNLMHPILWKENTRNQPQTLLDLCCVVINKIDASASQLPTSIMETCKQRSYGICDECQDTIFGPGLRVIRGVEHDHYQVKNLPFIFNVCSPECRATFRKKPASHWLKNR